MYYIQNSIIGIILVSIMLFYILGQGGRRRAQDSLFVALLVSTLLIIVLEFSVDLFTGRTFIGSRAILTVATFLFYTVNPIPGALYLLYLDQLHRRWVKIPRGIGLLAFTPSFLALVLSFLSLFSGLAFSIDANNLYHRGPLFFLVIIFDLVCMFMGFAYLLIFRSSFKGKNFSLFVFFPIPILVGALLQMNFYGVEVAGISLALTLLVAFLQMQNLQANKDYLTLLYNRSLSEQYLSHLILHRKPAKQLGGLLMDINSFKQVNDLHGHDLGDRTLRHFSKLLVESFKGDWFIARYGGDEFILFNPNTSEQEMAKDLDHFRQQLSNFNQKELLPFAVTASVGAAIYATGDGPSFIQTLDNRMYRDKKIFHTKTNLDGLLHS